MEKVHREMIQVNYLKLSKAIRPEILKVVNYLSEKELISETMEDDILKQCTPLKRARKLLDTIHTQGSEAYGTLYEATLTAKLWKAADILEPKKAPHEPSETTKSSTSVTYVEPVEEDEPLPGNWPAECHMLKVSDMKLKVKKVEQHHTLMIKRFWKPNEKEMYPLNYKCKGRVLIIENEEFTQGLPKRTGSMQDRKGLQCVFQALDFDVLVETNQTKEEMVTIIDRECRRNFNDVGCFILIILSHGVRRKVFGTDGNYVEIEEIKQRFSRVDTLKGKPKLFIIQACQNDETKTLGEESMVQESSAASNDTNQEENSSPNVSDLFPGIKKKRHEEPAPCPDGDHNMDDDVNSDIVMVDGKDTEVKKGNLAADAGDVDIGNRPHEGSDMFTALATTEGNPSFRNEKFGSWFIQAFIYVLENYAYKHDLSVLMKKVTQLVMKARSQDYENQVCERRLTMDKDFYFFPGLSLEMS